jgi:hypothetical protein
MKPGDRKRPLPRAQSLAARRPLAAAQLGLVRGGTDGPSGTGKTLPATVLASR